MSKKTEKKITNKKTTNPSTAKKRVNNGQGSPSVPVKSWKDEYFCMRSWREWPVKDDFLEELGKEFYEWCYNLAFVERELKPYSLARWRAERGIAANTLDDWRARNRKLDLMIKEGITILGLIREQGVLTKQLSERATMYTLPHYLDEWKKMDEYQDERKKKSLDGISSLIGAVIEEVDLNDKDRKAE